MLYETVWLFFALGAAVLLSIGFLGLVLSPAVPRRIVKGTAVTIFADPSDRCLFLLLVERREKRNSSFDRTGRGSD